MRSRQVSCWLPTSMEMPSYLSGRADTDGLRALSPQRAELQKKLLVSDPQLVWSRAITHPTSLPLDPFPQLQPRL